MSDPIELIYQFNHDAGLVQRGYDDFLESSFQIEEALEGFKDNQLLGVLVHSSNTTPSGQDPYKPKNVARAIVHLASSRGQQDPIPDVERLDKACDSVVFAIGSMTKLGLNVEQIKRALNAVMKANMAKLSNIKIDSNGKLLKDSSFIGPEAALQAILDEVSNVSLS